MGVKHCECGAITHVRDSRETASKDIRRRRECGKCGHRITTVELRIGELNQLKNKAALYDKFLSAAKQIDSFKNRYDNT